MGRVRRVAPHPHGGMSYVGRIRKLSPYKGGYLKVGLYKDGKAYPRNVHVLVAKAFCKNSAGEGAHAHHRNDNKLCNWSTNLE
jgi:hypothetical protein